MLLAFTSIQSPIGNGTAELQKLADADRRKPGPYIALVLEQHVAIEKAKAKKK